MCDMKCVKGNVKRTKK